MRDRERFDPQVLKLKGCTGGHQPPGGGLAEFEVPHQCFLGQRRAEKRHLAFAAQHLQPTRVVLMLMGKKNSVQAVKGEAAGIQSQADLLGAQPRIHQEGGALRRDDSTVPRTAAAEYCKTHHDFF